MLTARLKKIAAARGYTPTKNFAYGEEGGYTVSLQNVGSASVCHVSVAAAFPSKGSCDSFLAALKARKREFRLGRIVPYQTGFLIPVPCNKRFLPAFLDALPGMLRQSGARGSDLCAFCHQQLAPADSILVNAYIPCRIHKGCLSTMTEKLAQPQHVNPEEERNNHVGRGLAGALVGGIVGAIPWIIVFYFGYISGWLGLLIGLAAAFGYKLFGGKPCKAKIWIVVFAVIVGVAFGLYGGMFAQVYAFARTNAPGAQMGDIFSATNYAIANPSYRGTLIYNSILALVLAAVGCVALVRSLHVESKLGATKVVVIE